MTRFAVSSHETGQSVKRQKGIITVAEGHQIFLRSKSRKPGQPPSEALKLGREAVLTVAEGYEVLLLAQLLPCAIQVFLKQT